MKKALPKQRIRKISERFQISNLKKGRFSPTFDAQKQKYEPMKKGVYLFVLLLMSACSSQTEGDLKGII